ncbi:Putative defensin-like protein 20 [Linum perenne]
MLVAAVVVMATTTMVVAEEAGVTLMGICCREYYDKGECIPGKGDAPGGRCYEFCIQECKGALCKKGEKTHHCHCLC